MNDKDFIDELQRARNTMMKYAGMLTRNRDAALELFQETSVRAYDKRHSFTSGTRFDRWILVIMHNIYLNNVAHDSRSVPMISEEDVCFNKMFTSESADCVLELDELYCAIKSLPADYRIPFTMHLSGYTYDEVAHALSIPVTTVRNRIHAARVLLRNMLKDYRL